MTLVRREDDPAKWRAEVLRREHIVGAALEEFFEDVHRRGLRLVEPRADVQHYVEIPIIPGLLSYGYRLKPDEEKVPKRDSIEEDLRPRRLRDRWTERRAVPWTISKLFKEARAAGPKLNARQVRSGLERMFGTDRDLPRPMQWREVDGEQVQCTWPPSDGGPSRHARMCDAAHLIQSMADPCPSS